MRSLTLRSRQEEICVALFSPLRRLSYHCLRVCNETAEISLFCHCIRRRVFVVYFGPRIFLMQRAFLKQGVLRGKCTDLVRGITSVCRARDGMVSVLLMGEDLSLSSAYPLEPAQTAPRIDRDDTYKVKSLILICHLLQAAFAIAASRVNISNTTTTSLQTTVFLYSQFVREIVLELPTTRRDGLVALYQPQVYPTLLALEDRPLSIRRLPPRRQRLHYSTWPTAIKTRPPLKTLPTDQTLALGRRTLTLPRPRTRATNVINISPSFLLPSKTQPTLSTLTHRLIETLACKSTLDKLPTS